MNNNDRSGVCPQCGFFSIRYKNQGICEYINCGYNNNQQSSKTPIMPIDPDDILDWDGGFKEPLPEESVSWVDFLDNSPTTVH